MTDDWFVVFHQKKQFCQVYLGNQSLLDFIKRKIYQSETFNLHHFSKFTSMFGSFRESGVDHLSMIGRTILKELQSLYCERY